MDFQASLIGSCDDLAVAVFATPLFGQASLRVMAKSFVDLAMALDADPIGRTQRKELLATFQTLAHPCCLFHGSAD